MQGKGRGFRAKRQEEIVPLQKMAAARFLLLDWENVEDDNGDAIDYTPEVGLDIFNDPAFDDFWLFVISSATEAEQFKADVRNESEKNLRITSTTD